MMMGASVSQRQSPTRRGGFRRASPDNPPRDHGSPRWRARIVPKQGTSGVRRVEEISLDAVDTAVPGASDALEIGLAGAVADGVKEIEHKGLEEKRRRLHDQVEQLGPDAVVQFDDGFLDTLLGALLFVGDRFRDFKINRIGGEFRRFMILLRLLDATRVQVGVAPPEPSSSGPQLRRAVRLEGPRVRVRRVPRAFAVGGARAEVMTESNGGVHGSSGPGDSHQRPLAECLYTPGKSPVRTTSPRRAPV